MMKSIWWKNHPEEKYWLFKVFVEDLDEAIPPEILLLEMRMTARSSWSDSLVDYLKIGDQIFIWAQVLGITRPDEVAVTSAGLIGFGRVVSEPERATYVRDLRGIDPRKLSMDRRVPFSEIHLGERMRFDELVGMQDLRRSETSLRKSRDEIRDHFKLPAYGPWSFSESRSMEVQDGFLFKFRKNDVELLGLDKRAVTEVNDDLLQQSLIIDDQIPERLSWRNDLLRKDETFPIKKVPRESLDALVIEILLEDYVLEDGEVLELVGEFLGYSKPSAQLRSAVGESLQRIRTWFYI